VGLSEGSVGLSEGMWVLVRDVGLSEGSVGLSEGMWVLARGVWVLW